MGNAYTTQNNDTIGTAIRYKPEKLFSRIRSTGRKLYIEPNTLKTLENLNTYDQHQVAVGIDALASIPLPIDGVQHKSRPTLFRAKKAPGLAGNFIIKYTVNPNYVVVSSISLNYNVLGEKRVSKDEKSALYRIVRNSNTQFDDSITPLKAEKLEESWLPKNPVIKIKTQYAAVNGMLNNLAKASWLMGTHLDTAYKHDSFNEYTLFHNPSEGNLLDFYESVQDNVGFSTNNAKQLAAILQDVQSKGKPVKWVVHSQGGIIFKQALKHHIKTHGNAGLNMNSVSFHAGGNNQKVTDKLLAQVGIKKENPDRNNPFDIVSNIAGGNDLSLGAIKRSLQFRKNVKGSGTASIVESPHTLPFLSLEAYKSFLTQAGDHQSAAKVAKYMESIK